MFGREGTDEAILTEYPLSEAGLVPRALEYLFSQFAARQKSRHVATTDGGATTTTTTTFTDFRCACSFYEIYKERVYDLLAGPDYAVFDAYGASPIDEEGRRRRHQQHDRDRTESHQAGIYGSGAGFGASATAGHHMGGYEGGGSPEKWRSPIKRRPGSARRGKGPGSHGGWQQGLNVREDMEKGAFVEGLREVEVDSIEVARDALAKGYRARHEGRTSMNIDSSRSHAVFCLKVTSSSTATTTTTKTTTTTNTSTETPATSAASGPESPASPDGGGLRSSMSTRNTETASRFWMVDLAGSERQGKFGSSASLRSPKGAEKQALMKEAAYINKSLVTLGLVISDLADKGPGNSAPSARIVSHFRDSKLTFLLKDALCGNSRTVLVANISPDAANRGETLSTLKFAQRTKTVRMVPKANQLSSLRQEKRFQEESTIDGLRAELDRVRSQLLNFNVYGTPERPRKVNSDGSDHSGKTPNASRGSKLFGETPTSSTGAGSDAQDEATVARALEAGNDQGGGNRLTPSAGGESDSLSQEPLSPPKSRFAELSSESLARRISAEEASDDDSEYESLPERVESMVAEAVSTALESFRVTNTEERLLKAQLRQQLEVQLTQKLKSATVSEQERLQSRQEGILQREKAKLSMESSRTVEEMVETERRSTLAQLDDTMIKWETEKAKALEKRDAELKVREAELEEKDRMLRSMRQQLSGVNTTISDSLGSQQQLMESPQQAQDAEQLHQGDNVNTATTVDERTTLEEHEAAAAAAAALTPSQVAHGSTRMASRSSFLVAQATSVADTLREDSSQRYPLLEYWASPDRAKNADAQRAVFEEERIRQMKLRQDRAIAMHIERHASAKSSPTDEDAISSTAPLDGSSKLTAPLSPPTQVFEKIMGRGPVTIVDKSTDDNRSITSEPLNMTWRDPIEQEAPTLAQLKPMAWSAMATDLESTDGTRTEYSYAGGIPEDERVVMDDGETLPRDPDTGGTSLAAGVVNDDSTTAVRPCSWPVWVEQDLAFDTSGAKGFTIGFEGNDPNSMGPDLPSLSHVVVHSIVPGGYSESIGLRVADRFIRFNGTTSLLRLENEENHPFLDRVTALLSSPSFTITVARAVPDTGGTTNIMPPSMLGRQSTWTVVGDPSVVIPSDDEYETHGYQPMPGMPMMTSTWTVVPPEVAAAKGVRLPPPPQPVTMPGGAEEAYATAPLSFEAPEAEYTSGTTAEDDDEQIAPTIQEGIGYTNDEYAGL